MSQSKLPQTRPDGRVNWIGSVASARRTSSFLVILGVVTVVGGASLFMFTQHLIFSITLGLVGLVSFFAQQLVRKSLAITSSAAQAQLSSVASQLEATRRQVSKCKFLEHAENEGSRASLLADQLTDVYKSLRLILAQKFEPSEITYSRYLNSIDHSALSIAGTLSQAMSSLENINRTRATGVAADSSKLSELLSTVDNALRGFTELHEALSNITTKDAHRANLDESMEQIKQLAERAKSYSKT